MTFFRGSFVNIGEALKTISLAIAVLASLSTAMAYVYGTLASQQTLAKEMVDLSKRVLSIEEGRKNVDLWRFRIEQSERGIASANEKLDRVDEKVNKIMILLKADEALP